MLILIRHGQSTANAAGLLVGRTNAELTELGRTQARALRPWLTDVASVRTSPLARARETAALAVDHLNAEIDDAFIEQDYGTLDGQPMASVSPEEWATLRRSHDAALGGGESLADVDHRVHGRLDQLLGDSTSLLHDDSRHLAIVSHVAPIKSSVAWSLGVAGSTTWRMRLDNASLTVIAARPSGPYLVTYNDGSARHSTPLVYG